MFDSIVSCRKAILILVLLVSSPVFATEPQTIGEGVTLEEVTPIAEILAAPRDWDGKEVRVEGRVSAVCTKKGCWMDLSDSRGESLKIRVEDDVLVFPADAEGLLASAQGLVQVQELDRERYLGWQRHLASDRGESFDESTLGDGPYLLVEIAGSGATVGGD